MPGSTNHVSLQAAQKNFADFGAGELRHMDKVREPDEVDRQDKNWRPLDENTDNIEQPGSGIDYANSYPVDSTVLYYWRETYWRRIVS